MSDLDIPDFLRISPEQRRAAWRQKPPRRMPKFAAPKRAEDPETKALRREIEAKRKAKDKAKFARLRTEHSSKRR